MKLITSIDSIDKLYLIITSFISTLLAYHTSLPTAIYAFLIVTVLDTVTRIHADAEKQGLKFNPFKAYFYSQIKSEGLRGMMNKIFAQYGIYLIIAFTIDYYILDKSVLLNYNDKGLTLPIISLYIFSGIEIWSIGENIEDFGGINLIKKIIHLLPERIQKIFK